jgi:hypothetical protein
MAILLQKHEPGTGYELDCDVLSCTRKLAPFVNQQIRKFTICQITSKLRSIQFSIKHGTIKRVVYGSFLRHSSKDLSES